MGTTLNQSLQTEQASLFPESERFPASLIEAAAREGDRAVRDDPRYPPPGDERAAFWRRVHEVLAQR